MPIIASIPFELAKDVTNIPLRVHPLDVGFDLRAHNAAVLVEPSHTRASYAGRNSERLVVEGTSEEVALVLERAGYKVVRHSGSKEE